LLLREPGYSRLEMAVRQLFAQLEDQLHHPWTQDALARAVHCSVPHLNRVCRKLYGQGPMSRLADLRLQRARELLVTSHWQVSQIAQRVGYGDAFNFSHWFRSRTGMSPSQYRAQARGLSRSHAGAWERENK
nr:helix-turn-helix transcriptional regulator [Pseudomonadota bacterium]